VFALPARLLLTPAAAARDPDYGPAFARLRAEAGAALDGRGVLVLQLAVERCRGAASAWAPYVDFLPAAFGGRLARGGGHPFVRGARHHGGAGGAAAWAPAVPTCGAPNGKGSALRQR
jgi:hypothetical protein